MTTSVARYGAKGPRAIAASFRAYWFLALALLAFVASGLIGLARNVWSTEQGAHGPIILATGIWLLLREAGGLTDKPGRANVTVAVTWLTLALFGYLFGRIIGSVAVEWFFTYVALVAAFYAYVGGEMIRRLWFPLTYLLFLVPPPATVMFPLTRALKLWISSTAVELLAPFGFQVASSGTTLYVDQYELLVAAACSGMNSLVSLLAVGLFYIYLRHRAEWRYSILLALLLIPTAILANLVRVLVLMLVTHYFGDAMAQTMLHDAAGMMMFFIALLALTAADQALTPVRRRLARR